MGTEQSREYSNTYDELTEKKMDEVFHQVGCVINEYVPNLYNCDLFPFSSLLSISVNKYEYKADRVSCGMLANVRKLSMWADSYCMKDIDVCTKLVELEIRGRGKIPDHASYCKRKRDYNYEESVYDEECWDEGCGFSNCKNLKYLLITKATVSLDSLVCCTNLEELTIDSYSRGQISALSSCKKLRSLVLGEFTGDLSPISQLTELEHVVLPCYGTRSFHCPSTLVPFKNLVNLKTLSLNLSSDNIDLSPLAGLVNLVSLNIGMRSGNISPLLGLVNLSELNMSNYFGDLKDLCSLGNLRYLTIGCNSDIVLEQISRISNLQILMISKYGGDKIELLNNLVHLKHLTLKSCNEDGIINLRNDIHVKRNFK